MRHPPITTSNAHEVKINVSEMSICPKGGIKKIKPRFQRRRRGREKNTSRGRDKFRNRVSALKEHVVSLLKTLVAN
ncbi:hypothetical protein CEXT_78521 [Caerostris extrusa]|uniref:Uncharacterized protein n=1 Tax=Caerostris extrusa TaxID=172846 RepID=A0AAV4YAX8_CAEEX|nr:hypothetical protein CEXT_78521 [Caerostris extrusa]